MKRFTERFAPYNLSRHGRPALLRARRGDAVRGGSRSRGSAPKTVRFDYEQLSGGQASHAEPTGSVGTELIGYGAPDPSSVRIVDPETMAENPRDVGEIWVHGDHVAMGYWRKPEQTERTFDAKIVDPAPGTPEGPWLRTGDLGVISDGELFIMGRIKDLLIVDGRNHYPDDIEATIQEITGGRVAAISVPDDITEQLVAIIELKSGAGSAEEVLVQASLGEARSHRRDIEVAQSAHRRSCSGVTGFDTDHDERQGPAFSVCRELSQGGFERLDVAA